MVRAKLDIALWSGLYVIYSPMVSFDLRCQSSNLYNIIDAYINPELLYLIVTMLCRDVTSKCMCIPVIN